MGESSFDSSPMAPFFSKSFPTPDHRHIAPAIETVSVTPDCAPFIAAPARASPRPVSAAERMLRAISPVQIHPMTIALPPLAQDYAGEGQKEQCEKKRSRCILQSAASVLCVIALLLFQRQGVDRVLRQAQLGGGLLDCVLAGKPLLQERLHPGGGVGF